VSTHTPTSMSNSEIKSLRTEAIAATVALPEDKEVCEILDDVDSRRERVTAHNPFNAACVIIRREYLAAKRSLPLKLPTRLAPR
jgi:N-acetylglutamate synthase/N-acetylornithine aminotransferase